MINKIIKNLQVGPIRFILPVFFLSISVSSLFAQDVPQDMVNAIKSGNAVSLSNYFNSSVELAILNQEDIYTKQQAELIVKDFFTKHVPTEFTIVHKGGKEGSQYAIGNLKTSNGVYRVTLLIKYQDNKPLIHQLRFEEENAD